MLEEENKARLEYARNASSRHSRFGTTISVRLNPNAKKAGTREESAVTPNQGIESRPYVLHHQQALNKGSGILDMKKKAMFKKSNKVDEISREDNLSQEAKTVLRNVARTFIETCFNR